MRHYTTTKYYKGYYYMATQGTQYYLNHIYSTTTMLYAPQKVRQLNFKPVNETRDENWQTRIIGQKSKNYYNHLQRSVSYKDMADGNFTTNQRLLGIYDHDMEILLLAEIRRMATKHVDKMTELFPPLRSASRPGFILSLPFLKTNY